MRAGIGYDSHRFDPARRLVLGGVHVPGHPGLAGHSDGDAVTHALIDALLGAAGLGSIGDRFPDDDPRYEGVDSLTLLDATLTAVEDAGYAIGNLDVTVITESPRISTHTAGMAERIAQRCGVSPGDISIKGKSNEGLGWIGRGEGLAVIAIAVLEPRARSPEGRPGDPPRSD
jgi:2-C-methyl-D-erythritol 2,4-cyclodiphosphate synthase